MDMPSAMCDDSYDTVWKNASAGPYHLVRVEKRSAAVTSTGSDSLLDLGMVMIGSAARPWSMSYPPLPKHPTLFSKRLSFSSGRGIPAMTSE